LAQTGVRREFSVDVGYFRFRLRAGFNLEEGRLAASHISFESSVGDVFVSEGTDVKETGFDEPVEEGGRTLATS
jgi:hypothetical protein